MEQLIRVAVSPHDRPEIIAKVSVRCSARSDGVMAHDVPVEAATGKTFAPAIAQILKSEIVAGLLTGRHKAEGGWNLVVEHISGTQSGEDALPQIPPSATPSPPPSPSSTAPASTTSSPTPTAATAGNCCGLRWSKHASEPPQRQQMKDSFQPDYNVVDSQVWPEEKPPGKRPLNMRWLIVLFVLFAVILLTIFAVKRNRSRHVVCIIGEQVSLCCVCVRLKPGQRTGRTGAPD